MGKYFGTDGIRGIAGEELDAALAYKTGVALALMLEEHKEQPVVYIGRDTRISGQMLEAALTAGLCETGANVVLLDVLPTPAVAYLTAKDKADAGIVISASHNSYEYNGIKIFGGDGYKLTDEQEAQIEAGIDKPSERKHFLIGRVHYGFLNSMGDTYNKHIIRIGQKTNFRVLIDCANGAATYTARKIFPALGVNADFIGNNPDGYNINDGCGSTDMHILCRRVKEENYDLGIAFDGDADRCLLCDEYGEVIDGDQILGILAADMQNAGKLKGGVVATVISNLGLHTYLEERGIDIETTAVGDRHVLERMREKGWNLGGEQSGHVILSDSGTTGDGQLTAVRFLAAMARAGKAASELASEVELFPQTLINVTVPGALKGKIAGMDSVKAAEAEIRALFGQEGRILVRPSGTEPKVRVMVEGRDGDIVQKMAEKAAAAIRAEVEKLQG